METAKEADGLTHVDEFTKWTMTSLITLPFKYLMSISLYYFAATLQLIFSANSLKPLLTLF